jgi:TIR domain
MPRITISYRRTDSAAITGRLFDRLTRHFGDDSVFMDIDTIPFGVDFRHYIREALTSTDFMLVVIGPQWLGSDGVNRLTSARDPVRVEIEAAIRLGLTVVPILVDGASMPEPEALPEHLQDFAFINAAEITSGREFHSQVERLIRYIDAEFAKRVQRNAEAEAQVERDRIEEQQRVEAQAQSEGERIEEQQRAARAQAERERIEAQQRVEAQAKRERIEEQQRVEAQARTERERGEAQPRIEAETLVERKVPDTLSSSIRRLAVEAGHVRPFLRLRAGLLIGCGGAAFLLPLLYIALRPPISSMQFVVPVLIGTVYLLEALIDIAFTMRQTTSVRRLAHPYEAIVNLGFSLQAFSVLTLINTNSYDVMPQRQYTAALLFVAVLAIGVGAWRILSTLMVLRTGRRTDVGFVLTGVATVALGGLTGVYATSFSYNTALLHTYALYNILCGLIYLWVAAQPGQVASTEDLKPG